MLNINHLYAGLKDKEILKDFSLSLSPGTVHVIMGPNGCGKSTLTHVITGNPVYQVHSGQMTFQGRDLTALTPDERANAGIFLAFQNPVALPGVGASLFLKTALNAKQAYLKKPPLDAVQFIKRLKERSTALGIADDMLKRPVNVGFSGGEKKKLELLQMAVLEPDLCILDEMDAGLDVDALKTLTTAVNVMKEAHRTFLIITHYPRMLTEIVPDFVHIMIDGHIVKTGDKNLVQEVEENGYDPYR